MVRTHTDENGIVIAGDDAEIIDDDTDDDRVADDDEGVEILTDGGVDRPECESCGRDEFAELPDDDALDLCCEWCGAFVDEDGRLPRSDDKRCPKCGGQVAYGVLKDARKGIRGYLCVGECDERRIVRPEDAAPVATDGGEDVDDRFELTDEDRERFDREHGGIITALALYGDVDTDAVAVTVEDDPDTIASVIDRAHRHGYVVDESRDATDDVRPVRRRLRFVRAAESELEPASEGELIADGGVPDKSSAVDHASEGDRVTVEYQDRDHDDQAFEGDVVDTNDARDPGRTHASITVDTDDGDRYRVMFGGGVDRRKGDGFVSVGYFADVTVHDAVTDGGGDVDRCPECGLYAAHVFDHDPECSRFEPIEDEPDVADTVTPSAANNPRMVRHATDGGDREE